MFDSAELLRLAQQGATLIVPNVRAARQMRKRLSAAAQGTAESGEVRPLDHVVHWRGWVEGLWQQSLLNGWDDRVLLSGLQERLLWEQLLDAEEAVQRTDALTALCLGAAALVHQYNAQPALLAHAGSAATGDTARFSQWFRTMDRHCRQEGLLPFAALEAAVGASLSQDTDGGAAPMLVLCNLDTLTPAQHGLLDAVRAHGASVVEAKPVDPAATTPPALLRCRDDADEMRNLTRFLKAAMSPGERPEVAVIVPDLSQARDRLERALRKSLGGVSDYPFQEERRPLWEFSTGRPLGGIAIVGDALRLLRWTVQAVDGPAVSLLLRSPYFDWPLGAEAVASLDAQFLRPSMHLRSTWTPRSAAHVLRPQSEELAGKLVQRTMHWAELRTSSAPFSTFAEQTRRTLRDFGWPGKRPRSSQEFQAVQRWEATLDDFAALDLVAPAPNWRGFVDLLTAVVRETQFSQENTDAPIQFLTPEESAGVEAQTLRVLHADDGRWSSRAASHPLLPRYLQQQYGMPGVDSALDGERFRLQLQRIAGIAPNVTFSYAHEGDAGDQRPCSLLLDLPGIEVRYADAGLTLDRVDAAAELVPFADDVLVPVSGEIRGGVSILQSQAACAFRAFAERRLGATALESRDLGLDARDRGSMLHTALQLFWEVCKEQKSLLELIRNNRLDQAIHHAVSRALPRGEADQWAEAYLGIQHNWLARVVKQWLLHEAERPDFRVLAMEQTAKVNVGPLPIEVRVDRIDEVKTADGTFRVIIDYKTGKPNAKKWSGDRPDEPQLPLYATAVLPHADGEAPLPVGAIAFGILRGGDQLGFRSLPDKTTLLESGPRAKAEVLGEELPAWRNTLESLAHDFAAGIARVGPKEYPSTCKVCQQRLLCRLNPELLDSDETTEEA